MSALKPLLDSEIPEDLASVLRSAEADGPEDGAPAAAKTLASIAAHRAGASSAREPGASTGIPMAKTMLAVAVAVTCAGTAALFATFGSSAPHGAAPAPTSSPTTHLPLPAPPSPEGVRVDDLPAAQVEQGVSKEALPPSARRGGSGVELEDDLALIDAARAALAAKRPEAALARVSAYQRRFRTGHFTEEAEALEIQALVARGRRDARSRSSSRRRRSSCSPVRSQTPGSSDTAPPTAGTLLRSSSRRTEATPTRIAISPSTARRANAPRMDDVPGVTLRV